MAAISLLLQRHRWIWAALGVVILWGVLSLLTNRVSLHSLSGVATTASFLVLVAIGQMFVVTTGRGNIDLSIGSVVALSAFVSLQLEGGRDLGLVLAVPAVLAIGLLVGLINALLVIRFRIPAIIATLAMGYVLATATLFANRTIAGATPSPGLVYLAAGKIAGVPFMVGLALAVVAAAAFALNRLAYGRKLAAVGQNLRAAALAGVNTSRTIAVAFVISAMLAALTGLLLAAYVGGAFLEMGQPYLLQSVGAVVLGGSLIMGGNSSALGTFLGCLLLVLIVTTMQIAGLPPGTQDIVQGAVIICVLALAFQPARRLSRSRRTRPVS